MQNCNADLFMLTEHDGLLSMWRGIEGAGGGGGGKWGTLWSRDITHGDCIWAPKSIVGKGAWAASRLRGSRYDA